MGDYSQSRQFPVNKVVRTTLRSTLLLIGHVLTVDAVGLVEKIVAAIQKTGSYSGRPLPLSPLSRFSSTPSPSPFCENKTYRLKRPIASMRTLWFRDQSEATLPLSQGTRVGTHFYTLICVSSRVKSGKMNSTVNESCFLM